MGMMIEGVWHVEEPASGSADDGKYRRTVSSFRNWITPDGAPGGEDCAGDFQAEAGRYHLYVALGCPWAHRTMIVRALKGLEDLISLDVVLPKRSAEGWVFEPKPGANSDSLLGRQALHEIYAAADAAFSGRVTVPVLWDKKRQTIVNNESSEIIRMLNTAFDHLATKSLPDLYPEDLRADIDAVNGVVYENINNGVYRTGFATSQEAYEASYNKLFGALDEMEARLENRRYLTGPRITEADWRLFATLVRFDAVYVGHFKCNRQRIADYQNLSNYLRELYQWPGIAETVDIPRTKQHYYGSHLAINPFGVVPSGPKLNFDAPHDRGRLPGA